MAIRLTFPFADLLGEEDMGATSSHRFTEQGGQLAHRPAEYGMHLPNQGRHLWMLAVRA
jgi:hypothetical protein